MSSPLQTYLNSYRLQETYTYAIPSNIFETLDVKQWKYNRPPDMSRVPEIHEWMKQFHRMDGMLNLAYVIGQGLVCFEGNHRRLALKGLDNILVFCHILWDVTDEDVKHDFVRINKSVSVPDIYVVETDASLRVEIEDAISAFRKKYKQYETSSARPCRPNFNRDKLTDDITRIQKETCLPVSEIMKRLELKNEEYKTRDMTKLSDSIKAKCEKHGLWLFAWSTQVSL